MSGETPHKYRCFHTGQGCRAHWMVWWVWTWRDSYALAFTVAMISTQLNTSTEGDMWRTCCPHHRHQNTKWGNTCWKNGVNPSSRAPVTCKIYAGELVWRRVVAQHLTKKRSTALVSTCSASKKKSEQNNLPTGWGQGEDAVWVDQNEGNRKHVQIERTQFGSLLLHGLLHKNISAKGQTLQRVSVGKFIKDKTFEHMAHNRHKGADQWTPKKVWEWVRADSWVSIDVLKELCHWIWVSSKASFECSQSERTSGGIVESRLLSWVHTNSGICSKNCCFFAYKSVPVHWNILSYRLENSLNLLCSHSVVLV